MPPAVPIVAAVAGAAATSAIGTGIVASLGGALVATAVNAVGSRALAKKPKAQGFSQEAAGRSLVVRSSVESHKVVYGRARVSGPLVFAATTATGAEQATPNADNKMLHLVVPLAGHELQEIETVYLNDLPLTLNAGGQAVENGPYFRDGKSYALVHKHLGGDDQAADPLMVGDIPGWTAADRLRGIAYLYVRLEYHPDAYPTGIPNVSAVVKGKKVYDPRTGLTGWTDNAALCVRDYLAADYGFNCDADEINDAYTIAAANICEEDVPLRAGGAHDRYTCNGVVDTANAPLDNLQQLVTSLAGAVTYVQGAFRIHAAAYDAPSGAVTNDMLAGPVRTVARTPRKDLFNAVKGTYVDPLRAWQPTDFPPVTNPLYEAQDGGERIYKDVELPFTTHPEAAQRIAKLLGEKGRQGIGQTLTVNHAALKYAVYDVVTRTDAQHGWVDKPFRVMRVDIDAPGPITLALQEEASGSYDWNAGEATTVDPAPDTNLPNPALVHAPGALTVTESKYVTRSGDGVKAKATLAWLPSPDGFLDEYQAEYKPKADTAWRLLPRTTATTQDVEDIAPGTYDFRVKAVNHLGVSSAYAAASRQITGLLDAPPAPQNLTISTIGGLAVLRWDEFQGDDSLDVKIGGKVVFRHSPDIAAGWNQTTTIGNAVPGSSTVAILPLKPGAYLAKAVDSSGIESTLAAGVTTAQATALAYANVDSVTEHPTFSGTKTGTVVDGTVLKLTGSGAFDGIPDLDAVPDLDAYGGISVAGSYTFAAGIDLGGVSPVRLTGHVKAAITQEFDLIDSRAATVDDWEFFDGASAAEGDAVLYVRQTADDPAGTPAWGAWERLDSGEFVARGFQFKLDAMVTDATYNVLVSELSVTADEVA